MAYVYVYFIHSVPDTCNWQNDYEFSVSVVKLHQKNYKNASYKEAIELTSYLFWCGQFCATIKPDPPSDSARGLGQMPSVPFTDG